MKTTKHMTKVLVTALMALGSAASADLITPTGATASTFLGGGTNYEAENAIDGSGLNAPFDETATHSAGSGTTSMWLSSTSESAIGAFITFDLGSEMDLSGAWIWNYNQDNSSGRGYVVFDIYVGDSSDPAATTLLVDDAAISRYPVTSGTAYGPEFEAFSASGVQYVRFVSESTGNNDVIGLSEVRFEGAAASSGFQLTSITGSGADLVLTWESQAGKFYDILGTTDPSADPQVWTPLLSDIATTPPENTETFTKPVDPDTVIMVLEKPLPPLFEDDFEGDLGWTMGMDGGTGTAWVRGTPTVVGPAAANSPVNCYATNLDANYGVDANIYLRSPEIDLSTATAATLSFWQFTDIEAGFDYGAVRVLKASDLSPLGTDIVNPVDGVTTEWTEFTAPMPAEAIGENVILEFRFISDDSEVFAGWYVDDVTVTGE